MLMSKSRLEKFLYALYSLDSSDLPTPLSRIEELYKCWVAGEEVPTFKPLSRVEKYLMAILGVYDVELLPNPLSRVEVLLHKLATGDDNLDDVKSFLSEHEELLAEIIRNGGAGGNIDIEYVLYTLSTEHNTLYNTAEKPVKSAILKGNTLVNLVKTSVYSGIQSGTCVDGDTGYKVIESIVNTGAIILTRVKTIYPLSPSTVYYLKLTDVAHTNSFLFREQDNGVNLTTEIHDLENKIIKFTTSELGTSDLLFYQRGLQVGAKVKYSDNLIISDNVDSLYNADDYFTGMQSVKMPVLTTTGKNLFNIEKLEGLNENIETIPNGIIIKNSQIDITRCFTTPFKENTQYTVSFKHTQIEGEGREGFRFYYTDGTNSYIMPVSNSSCVGSTLPNKTIKSVSLSFNYLGTSELTYIQLEEGTVATSYEPYKSNILTTSEEVELRGIGDVKDELDLINGETIRKVGKITLNGSENWSDADNALSNTHRFQVSLSTFKSGGILLNDGGFDNITFGTSYTDTKNIQISGEYAFIRTLRNEVDSLDDLKSFLSSNPLTIIGELAVGTTSDTIDVSTVDQDGNDTKLSTFNDITHVTLSSEGLIPEAELEVATKNEEDLEDSIVYTTHTLSEEFNTLYNTAEKPVKSAILKGNTLVNINRPITRNNNMKVENGLQILTTWTTAYNLWVVNDITLFKTNTKYYIIAEVIDNTLTSTWSPMIGSTDCVFSGSISSLNFASKETGIKCATFTTKTDFTNVFYGLRSATGTNETVGSILKFRIAIIEYQEGMENWDIPYFEGMQSVKMPVLTTTGKNLFNFDDLELGTLSNGEPASKANYRRNKSFISVDSSQNFSFSMPNYIKSESARYVRVNCYDINKQYIGVLLLGDNFAKYENRPFLEATKFVKITIEQPVDPTDVFEVQLEEGSIATEYEPFKSNILTVNEDVTLRSNGDVYDELNLLTGRLTQRIDENNEVLAQEVVKTVDLSVADQDGNNTKLSTFDDITHVTLSSEGLIPEAELEVAEKVTEVAASMLAISHEQEVIDTTTKEQSENVDATMIATTEIYEGLL